MPYTISTSGQRFGISKIKKIVPPAALFSAKHIKVRVRGMPVP